MFVKLFLTGLSLTFASTKSLQSTSCRGTLKEIENLSVCGDKVEVEYDEDVLAEVDWSQANQNKLDKWLANKKRIKGFRIKVKNSDLKHFKALLLQEYDKPLQLEGNSKLQSVELSSLFNGTELILKNNFKLTKLALPNATTTTKYSIEDCPSLDRDSLDGLKIAKGGECSFPSTSPVKETIDLNYCKFVTGDLFFAKGATGGAINFTVDVRNCIHMIETNVSTLSFLTVEKEKSTCDKHEIKNNEWLCDDNLEKQLKCNENCGTIEDDCQRVCRTLQERKQKKCWVFRDEIKLGNKRNRDFEADLGFKEIEGTIDLHNAYLRNLDFLKSVEVVTTKELPLQIINCRHLRSIELPNLKKITSPSAIKIKFQGNRYKMPIKEVELLKRQLGLTDQEVDIEVSGPPTEDPEDSTDYYPDPIELLKTTKAMTTFPMANTTISLVESAPHLSEENGMEDEGELTIGIIVGSALFGGLLLVGLLLYIYVIKPRIRREKKPDKSMDISKKEEATENRGQETSKEKKELKISKKEKQLAETREETSKEKTSRVEESSTTQQA